MKKLYFIRHGESKGNVARIFSGQWDTPLTALGRSQAQAAAMQASALHLDVIVSSPLIRALETARIIAASIGYPAENIITTDLLMERNYGSLQQQSYDVIAVDNFDFENVPGIEHEQDVIKRAKLAAQFIQNIKADNILVVSHGSLGRALQQEVLNDHSEKIEVSEYQEIPNAKIVCWI